MPACIHTALEATTEIRDLLRMALDNNTALAADHRREQAISFAYGQASLHDPSVTRESVEAAYAEMHPAMRKVIEMTPAEAGSLRITFDFDKMRADSRESFTNDLRTARCVEAQEIEYEAEHDCIAEDCFEYDSERAGHDVPITLTLAAIVNIAISVGRGVVSPDMLTRELAEYGVRRRQ